MKVFIRGQALLIVVIGFGDYEFFFGTDFTNYAVFGVTFNSGCP